MNISTPTGQPPAVFQGREAENQSLADFREAFLATTTLGDALGLIEAHKTPQPQNPQGFCQLVSALWLFYRMESWHNNQKGAMPTAMKKLDDASFETTVISQLPSWCTPDWEILRSHLLKQMAKTPPPPTTAEVASGT